MLEIRKFHEEKDAVLTGLRKRNFSKEQLSLVDDIIRLDLTRKSQQTELDQLLAQRNSKSKEIGQLFQSGKAAEANAMKQEVQTIKDQVDQLEKGYADTQYQLQELMVQLPNLPHESVPAGSSEEDNEVYQDWADELPDLGPEALPHWELADKYGLIDFQLGAKITGAGFPLFRAKGSQLKRALINFFLAEANAAGYEEMSVPHVVNADSAYGTGSLPDKEGQMYHIEKDELYLIPTAEVPVTNVYRDVIMSATDFPVKMTAYTPCFRREAGSYGAHVKGLNRVHQFDKVEIVQIQHPEKSHDTLMEMLRHVEGLLQKLKLPYRILRLCGGDLTFASALTFDFEVWSAAQKRWLEVSSVSNFETFQSHRLKCRYRDEEGKTQLAHTLNGSALALERIVACLLENHQTADGIVIPQALVNYTGWERID